MERMAVIQAIVSKDNTIDTHCYCVLKRAVNLMEIEKSKLIKMYSGFIAS